MVAAAVCWGSPFARTAPLAAPISRVLCHLSPVSAPRSFSKSAVRASSEDVDQWGECGVHSRALRSRSQIKWLRMLAFESGLVRACLRFMTAVSTLDLPLHSGSLFSFHQKRGLKHVSRPPQAPPRRAGTGNVWLRPSLGASAWRGSVVARGEPTAHGSPLCAHKSAQTAALNRATGMTKTSNIDSSIHERGACGVLPKKSALLTALPSRASGSPPFMRGRGPPPTRSSQGPEATGTAANQLATCTT